MMSCLKNKTSFLQNFNSMPILSFYAKNAIEFLKKYVRQNLNIEDSNDDVVEKEIKDLTKKGVSFLSEKQLYHNYKYIVLHKECHQPP